jgi:hypothetical protein
MSKQKLTLSVNQNVVKKAREHDINISTFLEIRLNEYISLLEGNTINNKEEVFGSAFSKKGECGHRESNPGRGLGRLFH